MSLGRHIGWWPCSRKCSATAKLPVITGVRFMCVQKHKKPRTRQSPWQYRQRAYPLSIQLNACKLDSLGQPYMRICEHLWKCEMLCSGFEKARWTAWIRASSIPLSAQVLWRHGNTMQLQAFVLSLTAESASVAYWRLLRVVRPHTSWVSAIAFLCKIKEAGNKHECCESKSYNTLESLMMHDAWM